MLIHLIATILICHQVLGQTQDDENNRAEAFYQKINETITPQLNLYSKRVDCIINNLKNEKVIEIVNESNYRITPTEGGFNMTIVNKDLLLMELKSSIEHANFSCTIIGYCAIVLIVSVMLVIVSCVSCLSKRK